MIILGYIVHTLLGCKFRFCDLSVDKVAKGFLQDSFHYWYAKQVMKQLQDLEEFNKVQVNMTTAAMKELSAQRLTALYDKLRGGSKLI